MRVTRVSHDGGCAMRISELVAALEAIKAVEGDVPVYVVEGSSLWDLTTEGVYGAGGIGAGDDQAAYLDLTGTRGEPHVEPVGGPVLP